ncbi:hypothetical protein R1flu_008921 [Riccia fluitans]|uniref:Uncharacterized protein n=1 Tax=Riccia fluitans TaxID=41844 RepID=A0ABD1Z1T2_9MARC
MDRQFPFTLRVGQLMTGVGAGCGIGIGLGYPIAVGSIPVLGDVVRPITSAGSQAFGGVGYRAMGLLKNLGVKNLKAGVGCGFGIGHGFGAGLALKPGVVQQVTHSAQKKLTELTSHFQKQPLVTEAEKINPPVVVQSSSSLPDGLVVTKKLEEAPPAMAARNGPSNLTQNSVVSAQAVDSASPEKNVLEDLRNENQILRTLLRHQELIEDLVEENASLRHMLKERVELQVAEASLDVKAVAIFVAPEYSLEMYSLFLLIFKCFISSCSLKGCL